MTKSQRHVDALRLRGIAVEEVSLDPKDKGFSRREVRDAMAVAVPNTFLSSVREFRPREEREEKAWKLAPNHVADLKDIARGVEETNAGIATRYLIDSLSSGGLVEIDGDGYIHHLHEIEKFCDRYGVWAHPTIITWRRRLARARRAIYRMHDAKFHKYVCVLFVVYGYPDPSTREMTKKVQDYLGDMASLARYTNVVEVRRHELARNEAVQTSQRAETIKVARTKDVPECWGDGYVKPLAPTEEEALTDVHRAMAVRQGLNASHGPALVDQMHHRDRYEYAMRVISSSDALRSILAPAGEREDGESKEHFDQRKENVETRRDSLLSQIKFECTKLVEASTKAYHRAWLAAF